MKRVFVSGEEIKRRGWLVASVHGTSEKYIIPERVKPIVGNTWLSGDRILRITKVLKGRDGAWLLCEPAKLHILKIRRCFDGWAWTYELDGDSTEKRYETPKRVAQSNKDCCGVRIGHFYR